MHDEMPTQFTPTSPDQRGGRAGTGLVIAVAIFGILALLVGGAMTVRASRTSSDDAAARLAAARTSTTQGTTSVVGDQINLADGVTTVPQVPVTSAPGRQSPAPQAPAPQAPAPQAPAPQSPAPQSPTPQSPAPKAPTSPAPVITSFNTPENIDCHNGNFKYFSADWTTTNAVKTTISIDGPGLYKTYPANSSDSLPFNCSSPHTFLLTAYSQDGQSATRTITLNPRNVQTPSNGDDEGVTPDAP